MTDEPALRDRVVAALQKVERDYEGDFGPSYEDMAAAAIAEVRAFDGQRRPWRRGQALGPTR